MPPDPRPPRPADDAATAAAREWLGREAGWTDGYPTDATLALDAFLAGYAAAVARAAEVVRREYAESMPKWERTADLQWGGRAGAAQDILRRILALAPPEERLTQANVWRLETELSEEAGRVFYETKAPVKFKTPPGGGGEPEKGGGP